MGERDDGPVSVAGFIATQRAQYGVPHASSCRALGVSQAWFYKWVHGDASLRRARRQLVCKSRSCLPDTRAGTGRRGSPRICVRRNFLPFVSPSGFAFGDYRSAYNRRVFTRPVAYAGGQTSRSTAVDATAQTSMAWKGVSVAPIFRLVPQPKPADRGLLQPGSPRTARGRRAVPPGGDIVTSTRVSGAAAATLSSTVFRSVRLRDGRDAACCQRVRSSPIAIEGRLRVAPACAMAGTMTGPVCELARSGRYRSAPTVETCAGPPAMRGAIRGAKWGRLGWL